MRNQDKPAFPVSKEMCEQKNEIEEYPYGLTKREYFAAMAMQGLLAACTGLKISNAILEKIPEASVKFSDALLKELER
jgi:divalent metal cation (Fe/Co/Zn/Cd) transporter